MKILFLALIFLNSQLIHAQDGQPLTPLSSYQQAIVSPLGAFMPIDEIDGATFNTFLKNAINDLFHVFPGLYSPPFDSNYLGIEWSSYQIEKESISNLIDFLSLLPTSDGVKTAAYFLNQAKLIEYRYSKNKQQMLFIFHFPKRILGKSQALSNATKGMFTALEISPRVELLIGYIGENKIDLSLKGVNLLGSVVHRLTLPQIFVDHGNNKLQLLENGFVILKN